ncbi:hypothetical protein Anapl_08055 [Anas platyrhynchos]|uniref:Uncharacterized protein n=1 Tax=Anas platyrhynchos TaxID=8839 RepID=R0LTJ2_ANAPL|nr:hypothetical protein Anapl_08055 [Anas platyrhynchos]
MIKSSLSWRMNQKGVCGFACPMAGYNNQPEAAGKPQQQMTSGEEEGHQASAYHQQQELQFCDSVAHTWGCLYAMCADSISATCDSSSQFCAFGAPADSGTLNASLALCCTKANELFGDSINTSASDSRDFMDFVGSSV